MLLPRMSIRGWMVAVAVVAVLVAVAPMLFRSRALRLRAEFHAAAVQGIADENDPKNTAYWEAYWFNGEHAVPTHSSIEPGPESQAWQRNKERRAAYHYAMHQKYLRAAHYPWLSVEPDPPAPAPATPGCPLSPTRQRPSENGHANSEDRGKSGSVGFRVCDSTLDLSCRRKT